MWPWAHAAVGYLAYTLWLRVRTGTQPAGWPVVALGVGTQLPDLIDKPLAWYVHVLPYGRSFAHSLLTAVPLVLLPVVAVLVRRGAHRSAGAFVLGYGTHLLGDGYWALAQGEWRELGYLAWPLVPPPATEVEGLLAHLRNIEGSPRFLFGLAVTALALGVWYRHGVPGLGTLRGWLWRRAPAG